MNLELLSKLYEQSHKTVPHKPTSGFDASWEDRVFVPEVFAELIVQECASLARQKAKIIKTKTETYSADAGEMSVGLSVAWQFEVFAQELEEYFRSEL